HVGPARYSHEATGRRQCRRLFRRLPGATRPRGVGPIVEARASRPAGLRGHGRRRPRGDRSVAAATGAAVAARRGATTMTARMMRPLADLPHAARRGLRGLLTDIDETLSTDGRLTADAYAALERLRAAGLLVIPITGRPAG